MLDVGTGTNVHSQHRKVFTESVKAKQQVKRELCVYWQMRGTTCQVQVLEPCHVGQDHEALTGQALMPR